MSKMMLTMALMMASAFSAQAYTLDEIAVYVPQVKSIVIENGKVVVASERDAKRLCELKGGHLPSIEEMTFFATRFGAKFQPITTFLSSKAAADAGYVKIQTGIVNIEEAFFYSSKGYSHYDVVELKNRFWTNSKVYSFMPTNVKAYVFDGTTGAIESAGAKEAQAAVICVPGLY